MTVCIVTICNAGDAIVMAADTMLTGEDFMIEYELISNKIMKEGKV
jgi:hypothetical protein